MLCHNHISHLSCISRAGSEMEGMEGFSHFYYVTSTGESTEVQLCH